MRDFGSPYQSWFHCFGSECEKFLKLIIVIKSFKFLRYYGHSQFTWNRSPFFRNSFLLVKQVKLKVLRVTICLPLAHIVLCTSSTGYDRLCLMSLISYLILFPFRSTDMLLKAIMTWLLLLRVLFRLSCTAISSICI